ALQPGAVLAFDFSAPQTDRLVVEGGLTADFTTLDFEITRQEAATPDPVTLFEVAGPLTAGSDVVTALDGLRYLVEAGAGAVTLEALDLTLAGTSGADQQMAGVGDDTLLGSAGADLLAGGGGRDRADFSTSAAVTLDLARGLAAGGDAAGDTLTGIEDLTGSNFEDLLSGDLAANRLDGGARDDELRGRAGDDTLLGQGGNDRLAGGPGADLLDGGTGSDLLEGGHGADTLSTDAGANTLFGGLGDDLLTGGSAGDSLFGGSGADVLSGGVGNDTLEGGAGADTLTGELGADLLTGRGGADTFRFLSPDESRPNLRDTITDFTPGRDRIDLSAMDFSFIGSDPFSGQAGELRTAISGAETFVMGDVDGDGVTDLQIALTGALTLSAVDFIL
ncbi:MAG: calcium-binding protein, partial [Pseudomonadota bacterium]